MKFVMIGAGGTGSILGSQLVKGGEDVTFIARNAHLQALQDKGLHIKRVYNNSEETLSVKACTMDEYKGSPDVIFVCVKSYSLESVVPFIVRVATPQTVVIPVLNVYGTGGKLQEVLPTVDVLDGCTYLYAEIESPGCIVQRGPFCRLVFGPRDNNIDVLRYQKLAQIFTKSGIATELSAHIQRDALKKFSYVSPVGATGLYFNACAEVMQKDGEARDFFKAMVGEVAALAQAMGVAFDGDVTQDNLAILDGITPDALTSLQRDIMSGHASEMDGLIHEVVRLGAQYDVAVPKYRLVAQAMKERDL